MTLVLVSLSVFAVVLVLSDVVHRRLIRVQEHMIAELRAAIARHRTEIRVLKDRLGEP